MVNYNIQGCVNEPCFPFPFQLHRIKLVQELAKPALFMEEIHMIDFEKEAGVPNPTFFGIVRDPYKRFKSKWEFSRTTE